MQETNAKDTKGFFIYSPFRNPKYFFRVYKDDGTFLDYALRCEELEVKIDSDAYSFYDKGDGKITLDYSSKILDNN